MKLNKIIIFTVILFFFCVAAFILSEISIAPKKVSANPGTCQVNDNLSISAGYTLDMGCIQVSGGCLSGGNARACSATPGVSCTCYSASDNSVAADSASVTCPAGYKVMGGGCTSDSGTVGLEKNNPIGNDTWYCNWTAGVGWEQARAICCRTTMAVDAYLK